MIGTVGTAEQLRALMERYPGEELGGLPGSMGPGVVEPREWDRGRRGALRFERRRTRGGRFTLTLHEPLGGSWSARLEGAPEASASFNPFVWDEGARPMIPMNPKDGPPDPGRPREPLEPGEPRPTTAVLVVAAVVVLALLVAR